MQLIEDDSAAVAQLNGASPLEAGNEPHGPVDSITERH